MHALTHASKRLRLLPPNSKVTERIFALILAVGVAFGLIAGQAISIARLGIGIAGGIVLFLVSTTGRLTALRLILIWLAYIGFVRRFLIPFAGWSEQDPLHLVAPAAAVLIWLSGRKEAPQRKDAITVFGLLFLAGTTAQILNPHEPSILLSLKGLLFWVPAAIWLFVGRTFDLSVHDKIIKLVGILSIPIAIHGLFHSTQRFFPFEYTWIGVSGIGPGNIFFENFRIRSFSSLTSPQEYGVMLAFGICVVWGTILARKPHRGLRFLHLTLLLVALFLQGTRHTFALVFIMLFLTGILYSKNFAVRISLTAIAVAIVFVVQMQMLPTELGDSPIVVPIEHQIRGFQNPEESTAGIHLDFIQRGFERSWNYPLGLGPGFVSIAAVKTGDEGGGTEFDVSNVFSALGIPMGLFYLMFIVTVFFVALRRFVYHRSPYTITTLGMLIVIIGNWWNGGLYGAIAILWLTIGGMTRPLTEFNVELEEETEPVPQQLALAPA